jgi:hypothetical protein
MDIMAESGTQNTLHPDQIIPGTEAEYAAGVNNPDPRNVNPQLLGTDSTIMSMNYGATGAFPALKRSMLESLSDALIRELDSEANLQPSLARRLLQGNNNPSIDELYAAADSGSPRLSTFFSGASPIDNPEIIDQKVEELLSRMELLEPDAQYGQRAATEEIMAESGDLDAGTAEAVESREGDFDPMGRMAQLLDEIKWLAQIARMEDPVQSQKELLAFMQSTSEHVPEFVTTGAMTDAVRTSGVGSGGMAGDDPVSRRSLAPDFDPNVLKQLLDRDNPGGDTDMLMRLMGMAGPQPPRRNV